MLARLGMQAEYGTKDIMENPDFGLDFLLTGKGGHLDMKKCRFQAIYVRAHRYKVKGCIVELSKCLKMRHFKG